MLCYLEFAASILICAAVCALERGKRLGLEIECGRTASFLVMNGNYHVGSHAFGSENMEEPSRWHIILLKSTELSIFESVSRMKRTIPSVLFCFVSFTVIIWLWRCISTHISWTKKGLAESSLISFYRRFQPASQVN